MKVFFYIAFLLLFLTCCDGDRQSNDPILVEGAKEEGHVVLSMSQFQSAELKLKSMERIQLTEQIQLNGIVDVPPEGIASIGTYYGGYVKKLKLIPGQKVKKGEVLFVLENPTYIEMQKEFLEEQSRLSYLKDDFERQQTLEKERVSSRKSFLKAESAYLSSLANYESLKKQLELIHLDPSNITASNLTSAISIIAPISGYIKEVNVNPGRYLNPSDIALTIVNRDHMHLELNAFERDFPKVKVGQKIIFHTPERVEEKFSASIYLINQTIHSDKRFATVHGHFDKPEEEGKFVPGMYVEANIQITSDSAYVLPEEAVVEIDQSHFVLLEISRDENLLKFQKREVEIGQSINGKTAILNDDDFQKGSQFLTKGAFGLMPE